MGLSLAQSDSLSPGSSTAQSKTTPIQNKHVLGFGLGWVGSLGFGCHLPRSHLCCQDWFRPAEELMFSHLPPEGWTSSWLVEVWKSCEPSKSSLNANMGAGCLSYRLTSLISQCFQSLSKDSKKRRLRLVCLSTTSAFWVQECFPSLSWTRPL